MSNKSGQLKKLDPNKAKMLKALEKHYCNVSMACAHSGVGRTTHYEWMHDDPTYAAAVKELKNVVIDFYEQALHDRINQGSDTAIIFALKTQGKERGWQEKSELKVEHSYTNLSDEEIAAMLESKRKEAE
jgi:hypothetical protein